MLFTILDIRNLDLKLFLVPSISWWWSMITSKENDKKIYSKLEEIIYRIKRNQNVNITTLKYGLSLNKYND